MHACMHVCMHVCMYACMYVSVYVCMHIYVCMYVWGYSDMEKCSIEPAMYQNMINNHQQHFMKDSNYITWNKYLSPILRIKSIIMVATA